eukprot:g24221.t1
MVGKRRGAGEQSNAAISVKFQNWVRSGKSRVVVEMESALQVGVRPQVAFSPALECRNRQGMQDFDIFPCVCSVTFRFNRLLKICISYFKLVN